MTTIAFSSEIVWLSVLLIELTAMLRIMLRRHREPESRVAWIVVVAALSLVGVVAYIALGEVRIGRKRLQALNRARLTWAALSPDLPRWVSLNCSSRLTRGPQLTS